MVGDLLQPTHLLFVLVVALLVLGPKRLPEAGRALGKGLRDFRHAISGEEEPEHTIPRSSSTEPTPEAAPPAEEPADPKTPQADGQSDHPAEPTEPVGAAAAKGESESHS